jgi:hypothetical protein
MNEFKPAANLTAHGRPLSKDRLTFEALHGQLKPGEHLFALIWNGTGYTAFHVQTSEDLATIGEDIIQARALTSAQAKRGGLEL